MKIIGHRGAKGEAPENTLAGFAYLRSLGIHHVELDIHLSADKQLVVIHDDTVDRTTNQSGKVRDFTADQLANMNAHHQWPNWSLPNHPASETGIPRLAKVLTAWHELKSIQLEVKSAPKAELALIARDLIQLCEDFKLGERGIITSSSEQFHQCLSELHCKQPTGLVADSRVQNPIQTAKDLNCDYLCLDWKLCNDEMVAAASNAKLTVSLWTANDASWFKTFENWGIDSVITDMPSKWSGSL